MKKVIKTFGPRRFECFVSDVMGDGALLKVSVLEIRDPSKRKWWQSRTRYLGSRNFWTDDYSTIHEGVDICLAFLIAEEEEDNLRRKKFEDFEKSS